MRKMWTTNHTAILINNLGRIWRHAIVFSLNAYPKMQSVTALLSRATLATHWKMAWLKFLYQLCNNEFLQTEVASPRTGHPDAAMPSVPRVNAIKFSFLAKTIVEHPRGRSIHWHMPTELFQRKLTMCFLNAQLALQVFESYKTAGKGL